MKQRLKSFVQDCTASITVEFTFMVIVLCLIFAFTVDFVILRSDLGKLDRTSYAVLNIIKERSAFYDKDDYLSVSEFEKEAAVMAELAARLLYGLDRAEGDLNAQDLGVMIEYATFQPAGADSQNARSRTPVVSKYWKWSKTTGLDKPCRPLHTLDEVVRTSNLVAYSEMHRFVPVYAVTLCMKQASFFKSMTVSKDNLSGFDLRSTSMGLVR